MANRSGRIYRLILRFSLLLNVLLIPLLFLDDGFIYFIRHNNHIHNWITQPVMNSSLYKYIYKVKRTPAHQVLKLYQLMKDVHEVLEKQKIQYWIESGTLLGAVRHQGIIPWDGDLDIGIRLEDSYRFQQIIKEFEKLGYEVDEFYFGFKIYLIEERLDRLHNVCCDVFVTVQDEEKFLYYSPRARYQWQYHFEKKDLFPLKKYRFGEIDVWGPQTPEPYLTMQYGNWQTLACKGGEHLKKGEGSRVPFTMTSTDREPAKPTGPLKDRLPD